MQNTLKSLAQFSGLGLHSAEPVVMTLRPAPADHGIWFRRIDVTGQDQMIEAKWDSVTASRLCTVIANRAGVSVSTIEHIMAALAGCAIHNALIDIDGPEVPILDGSSAQFVEGILAAGIQAELHIIGFDKINIRIKRVVGSTNQTISFLLKRKKISIRPSIV